MLSEAQMDALDEQPQYRQGTGRITFMGTEAERRSKQHPLLAPLPAAAQRKRWPRRSALARRLQLDEMEARMRASDQRLRDLGLL
jgi:hypothetical protein